MALHPSACDKYFFSCTWSRHCRLNTVNKTLNDLKLNTKETSSPVRTKMSPVFFLNSHSFIFKSSSKEQLLFWLFEYQCVHYELATGSHVAWIGNWIVFWPVAWIGNWQPWEQDSSPRNAPVAWIGNWKPRVQASSPRNAPVAWSGKRREVQETHPSRPFTLSLHLCIWVQRLVQGLHLCRPQNHSNSTCMIRCILTAGSVLYGFRRFGWVTKATMVTW